LMWVSDWFLNTAEYFCAACSVKKTHSSFLLYLFINSSGFSVHSEQIFNRCHLRSDQ